METIKSYTDIEQSKVLAGILPLESADMYYEPAAGFCTEPSEVRVGDVKYAHPRSIACWTLAALLDVLPSYFYDETGRKTLGMSKGDTYYYIFYENKNSYIEKRADNPVDACVAMIELLHELKML